MIREELIKLEQFLRSEKETYEPVGIVSILKS